MKTIRFGHITITIEKIYARYWVTIDNSGERIVKNEMNPKKAIQVVRKYLSNQLNF